MRESIPQTGSARRRLDLADSGVEGQLHGDGVGDGDRQRTLLLLWREQGRVGVRNDEIRARRQFDREETVGVGAKSRDRPHALADREAGAERRVARAVPSWHTGEVGPRTTRPSTRTRMLSGCMAQADTASAKIAGSARHGNRTCIAVTLPHAFCRPRGDVNSQKTAAAATAVAETANAIGAPAHR
jgi:hypothetical protein